MHPWYASISSSEGDVSPTITIPPIEIEDSQPNYGEAAAHMKRDAALTTSRFPKTSMSELCSRIS